MRQIPISQPTTGTPPGMATSSGMQQQPKSKSKSYLFATITQNKIKIEQRLQLFVIFISNRFFSAQAQMLLIEIQNSLKLALPYLTKRCLKDYLGRE